MLILQFIHVLDVISYNMLDAYLSVMRYEKMSIYLLTQIDNSKVLKVLIIQNHFGKIHMIKVYLHK
jgi:hypothetical protein